MSDASGNKAKKKPNKAGGVSLKQAWGLVCLILVLDQASKLWIIFGLDLPALGSLDLLPFLKFTMVWNKGISMGLPPGNWLGPYGIILLTFAVCFYLVWWMQRRSFGLERLGLAVIIGGAFGNLLDRFFYGAVADFIHVFGFGYHFYVFNLADAAITLGAVLLILDSLRHALKRPKNTTKQV